MAVVLTAGNAITRRRGTGESATGTRSTAPDVRLTRRNGGTTIQRREGQRGRPPDVERAEAGLTFEGILDNGRVERLVVTLKLRKGTHQRAANQIAAGPPFDPADLGLRRHAVYLGDDLAVFVFEGEDVEHRVRGIVNDRVASASFAAWVPLL